MDIVYIIIAFVAGGGLFFFFANYLAQKRINNLEKDKGLIQDRLNVLQDENTQISNNLEKQITKTEELVRNLAVAETDNKYLQEKLDSPVN